MAEGLRLIVYRISLQNPTGINFSLLAVETTQHLNAFILLKRIGKISKGAQ
jgi:hypothetical protein